MSEAFENFLLDLAGCAGFVIWATFWAAVMCIFA